jgi:hypothetical protein
MLCLPYFAYVFYSTKLVIRQNRTCLELRRGVGEKVGKESTVEK